MMRNEDSGPQATPERSGAKTAGAAASSEMCKAEKTGQQAAPAGCSAEKVVPGAVPTEHSAERAAFAAVPTEHSAERAGPGAAAQPRTAAGAARAARALTVLALLACLGSAVLYGVCVTLAGGSVPRFLAYLLLAAALLVLPGLFLAGLLVPDVRGCGRLAAAFGLGLGFLFLNYMAVGSLMQAPWPMFVLPGALCAAQLARFARAAQSRRAQSGCRAGKKRPFRVPAALHPAHSILLLCFAAALAVFSVYGVLNFSHASAAGNMQYHQDMLWSAGNAAAVAYGFPVRDLRAAGGFLYYHYLSDLTPGFLAFAGGILPFDAACYYNYPLLLALAVPALYAAARAWGAKPVPAALLPWCVFFASGYGAQMPGNMLRNLNGVLPATLLTAAALNLLLWGEKQGYLGAFGAEHGGAVPPETPAPAGTAAGRLPGPVRNRARTAGWYAAFLCVLGVLLMSKNLYGVLLLCALAAAVVFAALVQRRFAARALALTAAGAAMFGVCWFLVFRHAINNLVFERWQSVGAWLASVPLQAPLGFALWCVSAAVSFRARRTLGIGRLTVNAAAIGGWLAYFLFHHYSSSQIYFLLAAILCGWFCALDGLDALLRQKRPVRRAALGICAGALAVCFACTLATVAPEARRGVQAGLRCLGLRPAFPAASDTVTPGDEAAALWLRQNLAHSDVFAVNRNAKDPAVGEGTWHYYTAMSGRQAYVESWRYAMDYGFEYHALRHNLEQVSDVIFAAPDAETAFALARQNGIGYLVVDRALRSAPFTGADPVYENDSVRIYRVA